MSDCLRNMVNQASPSSRLGCHGWHITTDLDYIHHCVGSSTSGSGSGFVRNHIKSSSIIVMKSSLNARIYNFGTAELCNEATKEEEEEGEENVSELSQVSAVISKMYLESKVWVEKFGLASRMRMR